MRRVLAPLALAAALLTTPAIASAAPASLTFATTAPAQGTSATTFVGSPSALWSSWAARSDAPAPSVTVTIMTNVMCGDDAIASCRETGQPGLPQYGVYASNRDAFYFELGGIFDSAVLTDGDRRFLARKWGAPHWHWSDTQAGIEAGAAQGVGIEDGLEGIFASIYQDCAWGHDTTDASYGELIPTGLHVAVPSVSTGTFDTCAYLRSLHRP
jgi:hypothetical protein